MDLAEQQLTVQRLLLARADKGTTTAAVEMAVELAAASTGNTVATPTPFLVSLTVDETAELLRLNPRTIREMFHRGELAGNQRGHAIRLSRTSVLEWLAGKCPPRAR